MINKFTLLLLEVPVILHGQQEKKTRIPTFETPTQSIPSLNGKKGYSEEMFFLASRLWSNLSLELQFFQNEVQQNILLSMDLTSRRILYCSISNERDFPLKLWICYCYLYFVKLESLGEQRNAV